jgi:vitamin B12 transporter
MTSPVFRPAAFASLALAVAAPSIHAQTATMNAVIVTATRTPQDARDIISDTVSISSTDIASAGAVSITELLQRQRGIEVTRNGGPGTNAGVFIRGANSNQSIVLVDGVRIGSATSGTAAWNAIPLSAVDHIEIVYGPLSTLYGADAIGGVIQIFTKKGAGPTTFGAFAGAGSKGLREYDASVAGGVDNVSFSLSAGKERMTGFSATKPGNFSYNADNDGYSRESAAGQAAWTLAPGQTLGGLFLHSDLDADFDAGAVRAYAKQKLDNVAFYSRNKINAAWTMLTQVAQTRDKSGSFSSSSSQIDTKQTTYTWQNDIVFGADTLQVLAERRMEEVDSNNKAIEKERSTNSFAASYNMKRGAHLLSAGVRDDDSSQYGSKTTGSLGYGFRFSPALRLSASFGTSFRAPTFNELYYVGFGVPTNRPEKGRNGEIGLHFEQGDTLLAATYYRNKLTDLLVNASPCPVPGFKFGCAYNVNKATLEGLSLTAQQHLGPLTVSADADLQNPRDDVTDKVLVRRAKKHGNMTLDYANGNLHGGLEWQVSGKRFDDTANTTRLGGYALVNLFAEWKFARDWSALVRWNNVGNKQYELARNYATAGSNVFAGLRYGIK